MLTDKLSLSGLLTVTAGVFPYQMPKNAISFHPFSLGPLLQITSYEITDELQRNIKLCRRLVTDHPRLSDNAPKDFIRDEIIHNALMV